MISSQTIAADAPIEKRDMLVARIIFEKKKLWYCAVGRLEVLPHKRYMYIMRASHQMYA